MSEAMDTHDFAAHLRQDLDALKAQADAAVDDALDASYAEAEREQAATPPPPVTEPARPWPELDEDHALIGLPGAVVQAIAPETEADPVAILLGFLGMTGCAVGRTPHAVVGATRHGCNEFVLTVGATSRSRKGTGQDESERMVVGAEPGFAARIQGGLSSGEGLVHAVRDATETVGKNGQPRIEDHGIADKRLFIVEPEFSGVLKIAMREGNVVTETLRRAWDGKSLQTLTRRNPLVATRPHIGLSGHITQHELLRTLDDTAFFNGFLNRFLLIAVKRAQLLPDGGCVPEVTLLGLQDRMTRVIEMARQRTAPMQRDPEARLHWHAIYEDLTRDQAGMLGAITARAEAHVLRLSLLYAVLDGAAQISAAHLRAALAVWGYAEASATYLFGDSTGDPVADRVLATLRGSGPLPQSDLHALFQRHVKATRLDAALALLARSGKVTAQSIETGGRPRTVWTARP